MITNTQRDQMITQYYNNGIGKKEIRSYEVSLWTLQDEFITVLKWSDVEQKGRIENPKMTLDIDGTEEFTFSIPMYYYNHLGEWIINPNWYNVTNGNLITSLRKIKVIFNKYEDEEAIFEFLITEVTETHDDKGTLICEVKCEGLAFHELGKIGYKIKLSPDEYYLDYKNWADSDRSEPEPINDLDYWFDKIKVIEKLTPDKVIDARKWYYQVDMNWRSFKDVSSRDSAQIYEESYATDWDDNMHPITFNDYTVKTRNVSAEGSNLYNITQTIAETFGVFCRYQYDHDDNYHICGRRVIFYNNFFQEELSSPLSFNYPHSASKISRNMDGTNVTTKLYVLDVEDTTTLQGYNSIMNSDANKTMEDYILNFDYLYQTKAITEEQYVAISEFEKEMRNYNKQLVPLQYNLQEYEKEKPKVEAKVTFYTNSLPLDEEQIKTNSNLRNSLDSLDGDTDGYISRTGANSVGSILIEKKVDNNTIYYVTLKDKGIDTSTVKVFGTIADAINNSNTWTYERLDYKDDDLVNPTAVYNVTKPANTQTNTIYISYRYNPQLYYDGILSQWKSKEAEDKAYLTKYTDKLTLLESQIESLKTQIDAINDAKKKAIMAFDAMMGPALREGYWQPEDYTDYGSHDEFVGYLDETSARTVWTDNSFTVNNVALFNTLQNNGNVKNLYNRVRVDNGDGSYSTLLTETIDSTNYTPESTWATNSWAMNITTIMADGTVLSNDTIVSYIQTLAAGSATVATIKSRDNNSRKLILEIIDTTGKDQEAYVNYLASRAQLLHLVSEAYEELKDGNSLNTDANPNLIWDDDLFEEENNISYKYGINAHDEYYPCLNFSFWFTGAFNDKNLDDYSVIFINNYSLGTNVERAYNNALKGKDIQSFSLKDHSMFCFVKNPEGQVFPAIRFHQAKSFSEEQLKFFTIYKENDTIKEPIGLPTFCKYEISSSDGTYTFNNSSLLVKAKEYWTFGGYEISQCKIVYPRVEFNSIGMKTDTDNLVVHYDNTLLKWPDDYYINNKAVQHSGVYYPEYFITIKPQVIFKKQDNKGDVIVNYVISNANTAIYLDALEVSKENAYPKVSYDIDVRTLLNIGPQADNVNYEFSKILYARLAQLAMINDAELKFENTFGYISHVELDLDNIVNDTVEIKNYKTKFEDLFSTIVAQTEAMKRVSNGVASVIGGSMSLSGQGLADTIANNYSILDAYLDAHFDSSEVVRNKLTELFTEASEILSDSNKVLNKMHTLTLENAGILAGFADNIAVELTPKVYRQATKPTEFKVGDIWITEDENGREIRYVSTSNSENSAAGGSAGFVKTYDGTLASITGAGMDVDADAGLVDIYAANELKLRSGKHLYIGADDAVDIIGNKSVNIGGTTINIVGDATSNYGMGGINLVATSGSNINFSSYKNANNQTTNTSNSLEKAIADQIKSTDAIISKVLINPSKIELGAADIIMRGPNKIQMITSRGDNTNTSAISISPEEGVFIGSGKCIRLFAGKVSVSGETISYQNSNNQVIGASVELNQEHLIMGFANIGTNNTTAIEMNDKFMIIAAGNAISGVKNTDDAKEITGTSGGLVGAKFTKNSIGFATQAGQGTTNDPYIYNAIIMNNNGITMGSSKGNINLATASNADLRSHFSTASNGSYVRIANDGIELGSLADIYVNANNFKLQTNSRSDNNLNNTVSNTIFAFGNNLQKINNNNLATASIVQIKSADGSNDVDVRLVLNQNGAYFKGDIYANNGYFNGVVNATTFKANGTNTYMKVDGTTFGFYKINDEGILTIDANGNITCKKLYITSDNLFLGTTSSATTLSSQFSDFTTAIGNAQSTANQGVIDAAAASTAQQNYARDIANGTIKVPHVLTTGIEIFKGTKNGVERGYINIGATGDINIAANGTLTMMNDASNSAVILNKDGITIASKGSIVVTSGATIDISSVNLTIKSNPSSGDNYFYVGSPSNVSNDNAKYIKYTQSGSLEIKGGITATTLSVGQGNNLLTYDSTNGLIVKGNITATSGLIGNYWNISTNMLTNTVSGDYGYLQKVFLGLTSKHNVNWIMYAGANSPEGEGSGSNWEGDRDVWAPFRISTRGELYTEILCLGNGPASVSGNQRCGGEGWADYVGKLWLFVKYADNDYRWECITSTQLWRALHDIDELWAAVKSGNSSSSNQGSITPSKPSNGCFIAGTQVELYDGSTIDIEKLQVGLKVKSYNEITHQIEIGEIASVQMLKHKNQIYDLILSNDTILTLTDSHPVLTTTGWGSLNCEQAYKEHEVLTKLLHEGDELVTINNEKVYIKQIKYRDDLQDETVYTCHVEPCRTFVVEKIVVHNMYAYDK